MAQRWNAPMRVYAAGQSTQAIDSLLSLDQRTVVLSAVKETASHAILLRAYESAGTAVGCSITLHGANRVWMSNMLEEKLHEISVDHGVFSLSFAPWQIHSVYIEMEDHHTVL